MSGVSLIFRLSCCLSWIAHASLASGAEPNRRLLTLENEATSVAFFQWREQELGFKLDEQQRWVPRRELLAWGTPRDAAPATTIELHDGSLIVADVLEITPREILFASRKKTSLWRENRLARSAVRAIIFAASWNPAAREQATWQLLASPSVGERLVLSNGDILRGSINRAGSVKQPNGQESFRFDLQSAGAESKVEIEQARVAAIMFPDAKIQLQPRDTIWIGWTDGSCVRTTSLVEQAGEVMFHLAGGAKLSARAVDDTRTPPPAWTTRVCFLQRESPEFHYLSNLPTLGFKHVPLFDWEQTYSIDRMPSGAGLRVGGEKFPKGIYMPTTSRLAYEIPEGMKTFHAEVAVADGANSHSVFCRVFLETKPGQWTVQGEQAIASGDEPRGIRVALGAAKRLSLVVERASSGSDHALWLNARLIP